MVKDINWYIQEILDNNIDGGEDRTKTYRFEEDNVIVVRKHERKFEELKIKIDKCRALGVNIPGYLDYKDGWILEEIAPGNRFSDIVMNDKDSTIISNLPYEHIAKYFKDCYILENNGVGIEPRRRNIFYDKEKGFSTIDVSSLEKDKAVSSLEEIYSFFNTYSNVITGGDYLNETSRKNIMNKIMRAFESVCPEFEKNKRWIYRANDEYAELLKNQGYDLSLTEDEKIEYKGLINNLVEDVTNEYIEDFEKGYFGCYKKTAYTDMLEKSIEYYSDFDLFDANKQNLREYIDQSVNEKIKVLYRENKSDKLKELYIRFRMNELNPYGMYDYDQVSEYIQKELIEDSKEISTQKLGKETIEEMSDIELTDEIEKNINQQERDCDKTKENWKD